MVSVSENENEKRTTLEDRSLLEERWLRLGRLYDNMMAIASIERCNCMVRYGGDNQMPAIRHGKVFADPEGREIVPPDSFEMMHHTRIAELLKERNEVYIGHMFGSFVPGEE